MPNWCYTSYKIVGDKDEVNDLYNKLKPLMEISNNYYLAFSDALSNNTIRPEVPPEIIKSDFNFFLGSIVNAFGSDYEKLNCRGEVCSMDEPVDNILGLITMTAWVDMPDVWDLVVSKYKTLKYYFLAEESGCEYFINSDTTGEYFNSLYQVDHMGNDTEDVENIESLFSYVAELLGVAKIESLEELDKLLEGYNETHIDEEIYYYKYTHPTT